jgi:hypothetical protein
MKMSKIYWFALLMVGAVLFTFSQGWSQNRPEKSGPVITNWYAPDKVVYGDPVRFYIEAHATGSDMLRVAVSAYETGWGTLPVDWTYLKAQDQREFEGYLQWNTFSSNAGDIPEWQQVYVTISVFDKAGNESNQVVFPITFGIGGTTISYQPPSPFDQGKVARLGYVNIELYNVNRGYEWPNIGPRG